MSDDVEFTGGSVGIDRRDFMRKSAIVGGMVWAAPMIQSIGSPAFAGSPITGEDLGGTGVSNFAFLVRNNQDTYKYEDVLGGTDATAPCVGGLRSDLLTEWCEGTPGSANNLVSAVGDGNLITYTITAPPSSDSAQYTIPWVYVKEGSSCYFIELPAGTTQFAFTRADIFESPWVMTGMTTGNVCD